MTLRDALERIQPHLDESAVAVFANGYISRAGFALGDRPRSFYMIGSMGLASAIGLGVAMTQPSRKVVVFDGDGNVLMNLGELATIGVTQRPNLYHVVLDNEVYASTGNQPTLSSSVDLAAIAAAAGYRSVTRAVDSAQLDTRLPSFFAEPGPALLLAKIEPEEGTRFGRVEIEPQEMTSRLRRSCAEPSSPPRPEGASAR